jgi:hypothetical protein
MKELDKLYQASLTAVLGIAILGWTATVAAGSCRCFAEAIEGLDIVEPDEDSTDGA